MHIMTRITEGNGASRFALALALGLGAGFSADFGVNGDASNGNVVLEGHNISPVVTDYIGVQGYSIPKGYYGIGVEGKGGYMGVQAYADPVGGTNNNVGTRYGVWATAGYGYTNYGIYGTVYNPYSTQNYGVYGYAANATGYNYGVYGEAPVSGANRAGKFNGTLEYTGSLVGPSDVKLKKNIVDLHNCTSLVNRLAPKEFEFRRDEYRTLNLPAERRKGLIAQDVEAVFPELVHESTVPESPQGAKASEGAIDPNKKPETYKTVDYIGLIPVLIGAIQEQAAEIEALKRKLGGAK
jgi:hypothetical protein